MYRGWRIIRRLAGVLGLIILMLSVGTSDFYAGYGQQEPEWVWLGVILGIAMMIPEYVYLFKKGLQDDDLQDR